MTAAMKRESGSLTVEAILFLIPFMIAFFILINTARFVQAEMLIHHAATQTAKQISTYSYILTKTDISSRMRQADKKSDAFISDTEGAIDSVAEFVGAVDSIGAGEDPVASIENVITRAEAMDETLTEYFSDPREIMYGVLAVIKSGGRRAIMTWVAGEIARGCIRESIAKVSDEPDTYLRNIGIIDGMEGLDFSKSKWLTTDDGNIEIVVTYKMKNLLFPGFDLGEYEFCQCASTLIW